MGFKALLISLPLVWNYLVLLIFGGFTVVAFTTIYSALLGVAIGLAVVASFNILGIGEGSEGVHIGFVEGTLSAFYGLLSLGVLLGRPMNKPIDWNPFSIGHWVDLGSNSSSYQYPTGGSETFINQIPYGTVIQGVFGVMFLIGVVLWVTRGSE